MCYSVAYFHCIQAQKHGKDIDKTTGTLLYTLATGPLKEKDSITKIVQYVADAKISAVNQLNGK